MAVKGVLYVSVAMKEFALGNWTRLSFYTAPGKVCLSTTNQTGYYAGRQAEVQGKLDIVFVFRQVEVQGK